MLTVFLICIFIFFLLAAAIYDQFWGMVIPDWINSNGTFLGILAATFFPHALFISDPRSLSGEFLSYHPEIIGNDGFANPLSNSSEMTFLVSIWCLWYVAVTIESYRKLYPIKKRFWVWIRKNLRSLKYRRLEALAFISGIILISFVSLGHFGSIVGITTSLIGFAFGILFSWSIRISSWLGTQRQGLGFGDVLLFGMIGSWMGWQLILPILILSAPIGIALFLLTRLIDQGIKLVENRSELKKINSSSQGTPHFAFGPGIAISAITILSLGWKQNLYLIEFIELEHSLLRLAGIKGTIIIWVVGLILMVSLLLLVKFALRLFIVLSFVLITAAFFVAQYLRQN